MKTPGIFRFIVFNLLFLPQIENVLITKDNVFNILSLQYSRNPYKWDKKVHDLTSIILNEQLVQALNNRPQQMMNVQSLYNEAINKMYERIPLQDFVEQLWKTNKKYDVQSFINMARAQLALYWRYRMDRMQDPYYLLLAAHCFYKIKNDVFFSRLNQSTQHLIQISIKSMPSSLQYLFGRGEFCLFNVENLDVIFPASDQKFNRDTNQIISSSWNRTNYIGLLQAIFEETEEDNLADLNLALASKYMFGYLHRLPEYDNRIGANNTVSQLENFLWRVELVDDNQLVFEQDEYLICRNGSNVYGFKDKTIYDKECQWSAGECNSNYI